MGNSLQEQLLKTGLVDERKLKQAQTQKRKRKKRQRHGEAVAMGMAAAARLAVDLGHCPPHVAWRIVTLLDHLDLPTAVPGYDPEAVWAAMASDKKKQGARLRFVLPLDIGRVEVFEDVPREAVLAVLDTSRASHW